MSGDAKQWCVHELLEYLNGLAEAYEDLAIAHAMAGHMTSASPFANLHRMATKLDAIDYEDRTSAIDELRGQVECLLEVLTP